VKAELAGHLIECPLRSCKDLCICGRLF